MLVTSYDEQLQNAITVAKNKARQSKHATWSASHLLFGLLDEDSGLQEQLDSMGKNRSRIRSWAEFRIDQHPKSNAVTEDPTPDQSAKNVLNEATNIKSRLFTKVTSAIHALEAICQPNIAYTDIQLKRFAIGPKELETYRQGGISNNTTPSKASNKSSSNNTNTTHSPKVDKAISRYCEDITQKAQEGRIDPVIGRDEELKKLVQELGKRISPNVLLIGEPGVGKTALVGGLALDINADKVPSKLKNARIFELDVSGNLVAGAYKGEVEERLKNILKAIKAQKGKAILFIDEIHILLDEKGSVGSGAVNLLKPDLARGEILVIGATTLDEYKKYIEKDPAFDRRFSKLRIEEPSEDLAIEMVKGIAPKFETYHELAIEPAAIEESVHLAKRYFTNKRLPVSAIGLLDFTLSAVKVMNDTTLQDIEELEIKWESLNKNSETTPKEWLRLLQEQQHKISYLEDTLEAPEQLAKEGKLSKELKQQLNQFKKIFKTEKTSINESDVVSSISFQTNIPLGKIQAKESEQLLNMEDTLRERVVGQEEALSVVSAVLRRYRAELKEPNKPAGIFFFAGPTGTGKTELAKAITELLFNDEKAMTRFDMSEFMDKSTASTFIGSPAGYVGYEEGGALVNKIRQKPYSVLLFDEIEKAHPDIHKLFYQVFDEGRLTDHLGKEGDFTNAILIFTSNAGSDWIVDRYEKEQPPSRAEIKDMLKTMRNNKGEMVFPPAYLGRGVKFIPFAPITKEVALKILTIQLKNFNKILARKDMTLVADDSVKAFLLEKGFTPAFGARPLKESIEDYIGTPLADKIIRGEVKAGDIINVGAKKGELKWQFTQLTKFG